MKTAAACILPLLLLTLLLFVFWGNDGLKEAMVFGSTFLAGAPVFWETHDLKKAVVFGSTFLSGALASWET